MKQQNLLAKLTLLTGVLLTLGSAQAQVSRRFDRFASLGHDGILLRTQRDVQREQAPAPSTPEVPSTPLQDVQYTVIELGGRRAIDITESGEIVGTNYSAPERIHAAYWPGSQSAPIDLGTLPGLNSGSVAINPRRQMVGNAFSDDGSVNRPLFWANPGSGPVELPGLPVGRQGYALDINPSGQIVGAFFSSDYPVERAVYWPKSNAAPVYLPQLGPGLPLASATSINASGKIQGDAATQTTLNVTRSSGPKAPAARWL